MGKLSGLYTGEFDTIFQLINYNIVTPTLTETKIPMTLNIEKVEEDMYKIKAVMKFGTALDGIVLEIDGVGIYSNTFGTLNSTLIGVFTYRNTPVIVVASFKMTPHKEKYLRGTFDFIGPNPNAALLGVGKFSVKKQSHSCLTENK